MDKMKYRRARKILEDYEKDNLDPKIRDIVQGWLVSNDNEEAKESALREIFNKIVSRDHNPGLESYKALAKSHLLLGFPKKRRGMIASGRQLIRISAAAASAVIILSAGWLLYKHAGDGKIGDHLSALTETATKGETKTITMPDGSEIELEEGSALSYDKDNFLCDRTVWLRGDAYFKVVRMDENTFTVHTSSIRVTVHGTEFQVRAHEEAATAEVMLTVGKVSVSAAGIGETMMAPGNHFVYDKIHKTIELHEIGEAELMRSRGMNLTFDEALDSILRHIGRQYGVKMSVQQGVGLDNEVVLELKGNETIEDVMFILKKATNLFDYDIRQDTVFVYGRR